MCYNVRLPADHVLNDFDDFLRRASMHDIDVDRMSFTCSSFVVARYVMFHLVRLIIQYTLSEYGSQRRNSTHKKHIVQEMS